MKNRVKSRCYEGKTPTEVTKLPQKSMAILHGKGLQDLSHCNDRPDLRGSELTVHGSCKWTALYWDQVPGMQKINKNSCCNTQVLTVMLIKV